jgi:hypothetical protein
MNEAMETAANTIWDTRPDAVPKEGLKLHAQKVAISCRRSSNSRPWSPSGSVQWIFKRQPPARGEVLAIDIAPQTQEVGGQAAPRDEDISLDTAPRAPKREKGQAKAINTAQELVDWHLYDNRYWIYVPRNAQHVLQIRPLQQRDITCLPEATLRVLHEKERVGKLYHGYDKSHDRTTIPLVVAFVDGKEVPAALPTCGYNSKGDMLAKDFRFCYKGVEPWLARLIDDLKPDDNRQQRDISHPQRGLRQKTK